MVTPNSVADQQQGSSTGGELRHRSTSSSTTNNRGQKGSRDESGMQLPSWKEMIEALMATGLAIFIAVGANSFTRHAIHNLQQIHPA